MVDHQRIRRLVAKSAKDNLAFEIVSYVEGPMSGNSLDGSRETVRAFASRRFTGKEAIRHITGQHRLNGERGAMDWYCRFLASSRVSAAPQGIDPELWSQYVKDWAWHEVLRVRREGLPGEHVLNDTTSYRWWRASENGVIPARRRAARKTPKGDVLKRRTACAAPWDAALASAIAWTASERARGFPKSYAGGNFKDGQLAWVASLQRFKAQSAREATGRPKAVRLKDLFDNVKRIERQNAELDEANEEKMRTHETI
jgi:hypothetical protein